MKIKKRNNTKPKAKPILNGNYQAHYWIFIDEKFVKCSNSACFGGLQQPMCFGLKYQTSTLGYKVVAGKMIYVGKYDNEITRKYQNLLVSTINQITPCQKIVVEGNEYIEIKLLETYDQSLILLNFIRNLWYESHPGYSVSFFEELKKLRRKDPLTRLTMANKAACHPNRYYSMGHSNAHSKESLKIRKVSELLAFKGYSTKDFLTH